MITYMAKKGIFQFQIDKHISYLLVKGDKDEQAQKIVISGMEANINFDKFAYIKVFYNDEVYSKGLFAISDYSLAFKTDWQIIGYNEEKHIITLENLLSNKSNNAIIKVSAEEKPYVIPTIKKTIELNGLFGWESVPKGEHVIRVIEKRKDTYSPERIVVNNEIIIKE